MKKFKFTVEDKIRTAKLPNLKLLKAKVYILQKNLGQIYKKEKCKIAHKESILHIGGNKLIQN
ncbi:hypothetical protein [Mesomycoplasma ovipneumoniae]|uniref:hypothetical protein n=1 Tax=Mesomycoplasma ovipneumoniae TaxID=29562 RepID=UPI00083E87E2|nr:hypothetical protein [Mesomycoplasma ovipneumoniae]MDW2911992.1 hypothetical protein [Mesomycoplasma ovipneumoniae]MDW2917031.1 hypothetical protein [Mesomycoplasma ovipneumoniae]UVO15972.1 hypothetical protein KW545_03665 [Mesomycoplasma ovipneumoniae]WDV49009.1 hypothetical protein PWA39_01830 [Mesomycoplasma ovipneumoniae ATCC 29419]